MYEEENLDEELDETQEEGLEDETESDEEYNDGEEEYDDGGTSNSNISDRIKDEIDRRRNNNDLKDDIDNTKNNNDNKNRENKDNKKNKKNSEKKDNDPNAPKDKPNQLGKKPNNQKNQMNGNDQASKEIGDKINKAKNNVKQNNPAFNQGKTPGTQSGGASKAGGETAKKGLSEGTKKGGQAAGKAAKKGAEATAKATKKVIEVISKLPPEIQIGILVVVLVLFLVLIIMLLIVPAAAGDSGSGVAYDPTSTDKTEFMCSMVNPLSNKIGSEGASLTSLFGYRTYGGGQFHEAVDLVSTLPPLENGDIPVYAVHAGTATTTWYGSGGNTVIIEHENGFKSYYLHLKGFAIAENTEVEVNQGDIIGYEGNTGGDYAVHLDLRIKDETGNWFSLNPYFGISDVGYEDCLIDDPKKTASEVLEMGNKCGHGGSNSTNRLSNTINFQEDVCSKYNFSNNQSTSTDILSFIAGFEGTTTECTTTTGDAGYKAENIGDGTITVGMGFTNHAIGKQKYTDIINNSGYTSLFSKNGSHYLMNEGTCIPQTLANELAMGEVAEVSQTVVNFVNSNGVQLEQHQIDALTSFSYQNGNGALDSSGTTPLDSLLRAYKNFTNTSYTNGKTCKCAYEGIWSKMGLYNNPGTQFTTGLKKRRKAEFALFVTGDYTDKGLFYSRTINDYDNFNSESVVTGTECQ